MVSTNSDTHYRSLGSFGSSFVSTGPVNPAAGASTAVLLFGANNVTVDHNTITGGSDLGIAVAGASTNTTISTTPRFTSVCSVVLGTSSARNSSTVRRPPLDFSASTIVC